MFISQRGSRERDEGRGQEQEKRRRSGTGCDSFGPSAHQIVWWAKNAHGSESVWELSSDKGGSYACYSPIKPVSHTRAGGEEKGRAKDFHTKGNKQVHLLATNQSGGFCANINKKKGRKINKWGIYCTALEVWRKMGRMLTTRTHERTRRHTEWEKREKMRLYEPKSHPELQTWLCFRSPHAPAVAETHWWQAHLQIKCANRFTVRTQSASCNKALVFSKRKKMHSALVMLTAIVRITTIMITIIIMMGV